MVVGVVVEEDVVLEVVSVTVVTLLCVELVVVVVLPHWKLPSSTLPMTMLRAATFPIQFSLLIATLLAISSASSNVLSRGPNNMDPRPHCKLPASPGVYTSPGWNPLSSNSGPKLLISSFKSIVEDSQLALCRTSSKSASTRPTSSGDRQSNSSDNVVKPSSKVNELHRRIAVFKSETCRVHEAGERTPM